MPTYLGLHELTKFMLDVSRVLAARTTVVSKILVAPHFKEKLQNKMYVINSQL